MNDIQEYSTRKAAQAEAEGFRGWGKVRVVRVEFYVSKPGEPGNYTGETRRAWAIKVEGDKYLRTDGHVR